MILLDLHQVIYSNIAMSIKKTDEIEEDLIRHMILNTIRSNNMKFKSQFGKLIIVADHKVNWRKKIFPYYKAGRKKALEKSVLNWPKLFEIMDKVKGELHEFMPYPFVMAEGAEADDCMAAMVTYFPGEPILILSADKDFVQLHDRLNTSQYDPVRKKQIQVSNPALALKEHIIRGDSGDGIPNILSPDDCFVRERRQSPVTKKQLEIWLEIDPDSYEYEARRNFRRNQTLIDLSFVPPEIEQDIFAAYEANSKKTYDKMFGYFMDKGLKNLMENINDFE
jgi:hypothetical protein